MADNSFEVVNASGNMLVAALHIRRSLCGEGAALEDTLRALSDISLTTEILKDVVGDLNNIMESFGGRRIPQAKVDQARQDMNELSSGLKLAGSAAYSASRALCSQLNYGVPDSQQETEPAAKSPKKSAASC